jgi:hypothetical protein
MDYAPFDDDAFRARGFLIPQHFDSDSNSDTN